MKRKARNTKTAIEITLTATKKLCRTRILNVKWKINIVQFLMFIRDTCLTVTRFKHNIAAKNKQ